eukprot:1508899-Rhodomonas_salina.1
MRRSLCGSRRAGNGWTRPSESWRNKWTPRPFSTPRACFGVLRRNVLVLGMGDARSRCVDPGKECEKSAFDNLFLCGGCPDQATDCVRATTAMGQGLRTIVVPDLGHLRGTRKLALLFDPNYAAALQPEHMLRWRATGSADSMHTVTGFDQLDQYGLDWTPENVRPFLWR